MARMMPQTMSSPKLVHIVTSPLTAVSFLRGQLNYFRERDFEVTLISHPGPELDQIRQREGVAVIGVPMRREPSPWQDLVSLRQLTKVLRSIRPDIVHCGTPKASFLGGLAAFLARVPVRVMTLHGMRADGLRPPARGMVLTMERISCWSAHRVYCVGESLRQRALELRLAKAAKLRILARGTANGIDADYFSRSPEVMKRAKELRQQLSLSPEQPVIGFVGRLVRDKGVTELLAAFQQLKHHHAGLKLLLVGPFEEYDGLSAGLRQEIQSDPQIAHLGFLDDPRPAFALMSVLALPTYREGFPYVPMEAAAMEVPVVATAVTGCLDAVVPGITGKLVPPRESAPLSAALHEYLMHPELSAAHGLAGRERVVRDFQPLALWESQERDYRELLERLPKQNSKFASPAAACPAALNLALQENRIEI